MARNRWYYAPCPRGLEDVLAGEIDGLGGNDVAAERGGVRFSGSAKTGYAVALWSRVASRVLEELVRGHIAHVDEVYDLARTMEWRRTLRPGQTLAVRGTASSRLVDHDHYLALRVKDAVVDQIRDATGSRPDVDTDDPDLPLRVHVKDTVATISRDLAGAALAKRGYREGGQHKSPLNEALAAGLLLLSNWDRTSVLADPMCGSGTLLVEAAFLAGDRAPGLGRGFAFERWSDRDRNGWQALQDEANARWEAGRSAIPVLLGNDRHPGALDLARRSVGRAGLDGRIRLFEGSVADWTPPEVPAFVLTNPPYGERLDGDIPDDLQNTWYTLGRFLKEQCPGADAWILAGNPDVTRHLHLKAERKVPVWNGPIECRLLHYRIRERSD
jgi:23S rRNA G2445 N2-methylase RlmL